ncbi:MAG: 2Fe-2S iron-sulfur cluster binding domain-containing protein [Flavobacteriales bacterium]|nr:2Fe-2S iron-sulfur cluster binding domain-containing protein [Flavobacteriales bacterium]
MFRDFVVDKIVRENASIKSFYLKRANQEALERYLPGQYVTLKLKLANQQKEYTRNYTLSDSPGLGSFRLTIKREERGEVSRYLHDELKEGDCLEVSKPVGDFHLVMNNSRPVVLLSGGVGITPMLSILEYLVNYEQDRAVYFIHSSTSKTVQPMLKRLLALDATHKNLFLSIHHSQPASDEQKNEDYHQEGRIDKAFLQSALPIKEMDCFLCGPVGFMEDMYLHLRALGVEEDQISYEFFGGGKKLGNLADSSGSNDNSNTFNVLFTKSNKETQWDGSQLSLLDLAEAEGLTPDFSCRMGTCSTCETSLLSGKTEYDPEPFMETSEDKIFICCSKPVSDIEIDL